jgi:hypothetical protein
MLRCSYCGENGATVGCCSRGCKENYHFGCARAGNAVLLKDMSVYCFKHNPLSVSTSLAEPEDTLEVRSEVVDGGGAVPMTVDSTCDNSELKNETVNQDTSLPSAAMVDDRIDPSTDMGVNQVDPTSSLSVGTVVEEKHSHKPKKAIVFAEEWTKNVDEARGLFLEARPVLHDSDVSKEMDYSHPGILAHENMKCEMWESIRMGALTIHTLGEYPRSMKPVSVVEVPLMNVVDPSPSVGAVKSEPIESITTIDECEPLKHYVALPWYHDEFRLFPLGFRSTRISWSWKTPLRRTMYVNEVLEVPVAVANDLASYLNEKHAVKWNKLKANKQHQQSSYSAAIFCDVTHFQPDMLMRLQSTPKHTCEHCSRMFWNYKLTSGKDRLFCSVVCCNHWNKTHRSHLNAVRYYPRQHSTVAAGEDVNTVVVFRITSADALHEPFIGFSPDQAYFDMFQAIYEARSQAIDEIVKSSLPNAAFAQEVLDSRVTNLRHDFSSFGLTPSQWFGFGIPIVHRRLERMGGSINLIVASSSTGHLATLQPSSSTSLMTVPSYHCQYELPTEDAILQARRSHAAEDASIKPNPSGCARAETCSYLASDKAKEMRVTRELIGNNETAADGTVATKKARTKMAGSDDLIEGVSRSKTGLHAEVDSEVDVRQIEFVTRRYRAMKAVPTSERLVAKRSHVHGWGLFVKVLVCMFEM